MVNLSSEAISIIRSIVDSMDISSTTLDDIEVITDLVLGELDENYPSMRVRRSDIRSYLLQIFN